ncbi:MAG: DUF4923 family protein [Ekhidna sp.]
MKKNILNQIGLLLVAVSVLTFTSCSEDDEPTAGGEGNVSTTILGTWTTGSFTVSELSINGGSIADFFAGLGLEGELLDQLVAGLESGFEEDLAGSGNVAFTFNADGTYSVTDSEGTESGTWELNSSETMITFDEGDESEFTMDVVSITATKFVGAFTETDSSEDLDEDGSNDTIKITAQLILERN